MIMLAQFSWQENSSAMSDTTMSGKFTKNEKPEKTILITFYYFFFYFFFFFFFL